jgi:hypothetical protein
MIESFINNVSVGDFGGNLLQLSLDVMRPALGLIAAPALTATDYDALRSWTSHWDQFEYFPYIEAIPFSATIAALERSLPAGRGTVLFDWVRRSCPLCDPTQERSDMPAFAAREWLDSLKKAHRLNQFTATGVSEAGIEKLLSLLAAFDARMDLADTFAKTLRKEWEAHPEDPKQWEYNLKSKTAWDRFVYENCSQKWSFDLSFDITFLVRDQETHRFVRAYTSQLSPADHAAVRNNLADALEFRDTHPMHTHAVARLRRLADSPLESLLPFTQEPLEPSLPF